MIDTEVNENVPRKRVAARPGQRWRRGSARFEPLCLINYKHECRHWSSEQLEDVFETAARSAGTRVP